MVHGGNFGLQLWYSSTVRLAAIKTAPQTGAIVNTYFQYLHATDQALVVTNAAGEGDSRASVVGHDLELGVEVKEQVLREAMSVPLRWRGRRRSLR
jgi:hypothetical protein